MRTYLPEEKTKISPLWVYNLGLGIWVTTTAMHIPDGYLSPATSLVLFLFVLPFWVRGVQQLRQSMNAKNVPLIALLAAFSFVIMMFNIPLPGGTSGHAVGGALMAILLGPQIATIAISIALLIQALFFGDGGILAFGANCFNMAVVLPYVSAALYQFIARDAPVDSKRHLVGAAVGGWAGLSAAAFVAAIEFGIQPALFHSADGTPLYAPYPLSISLPAMVIPHLLAAAVVEGGITALVLTYLQRANRPLLRMNLQAQASSSAEMSHFARLRGLWSGLAVLTVATPLGLLAPGTAWGEWSTAELSNLGLTFIPKGMQRLSNLWSAPLPDYDLPALGNARLAYLFSAIIGILLTFLMVWLFTHLAVSHPPSPKTPSSGLNQETP